MASRPELKSPLSNLSGFGLAGLWVLVMEMVVGDSARFVEGDPFRFKQSFFHLEPTPKTTKCEVGTYHPMTGYQDGKWVGR